MDKKKDRLRVKSFDELKKQREKEREQRRKHNQAGRPRLKGRMRQSIAQRSMKTRTQQALSRGISGQRHESLETYDNLASNDIVQVVLRQLAPLALPDHEFYAGVVVMLRWVLIGVSDFFKKHAVDAKELMDLHQRFVSVFDLTRISKAVVPKQLWSWALRGPGDQVADMVSQILMRVSVSDPAFPEMCGIVVRKAMESLSKMSTVSPRLVGSMFTDLLGRFAEGKIWGSLTESVKVEASPGDMVVVVSKQLYSSEDFPGELGSALIPHVNKYRVSTFLLSLYRVGANLRPNDSWFFVFPDKEQVEMFHKNFKTLVPSGVSPGQLSSGKFVGVLPSSNYGQIMTDIGILQKKSVDSLDAVMSFNAEVSGDTEVTTQIWRKELSALGSDPREWKGEDKKRGDRLLQLLAYLGVVYAPDRDDMPLEPEDDFDVSSDYEDKSGPFEIRFGELCGPSGLASVFSHAKAVLGSFYKACWGDSNWMSTVGAVRDMVVEYAVEAPQGMLCWEDEGMKTTPGGIEITSRGGVPSSSSGREDAAQAAKEKEQRDLAVRREARDLAVRRAAEEYVSVMRSSSMGSEDYRNANYKLQRLLVGRNRMYQDYIADIRASKEAQKRDSERRYAPVARRLEQQWTGEVASFGADAVERIKREMFQHPDVANATAKSFGMYIFMELPQKKLSEEAKAVDEILYQLKAQQPVSIPRIYPDVNLVLSDDPTSEDYGLYQIKISGKLFDASVAYRAYLLHKDWKRSQKQQQQYEGKGNKGNSPIGFILGQVSPIMDIFLKVAGPLTLLGSSFANKFNREKFLEDPWVYLQGLYFKRKELHGGPDIRWGWVFELKTDQERTRTLIVEVFKRLHAKKLDMKSPVGKGSPLDVVMGEIAQRLVQKAMSSGDLEFGTMPADLSYEEMSKRYKERLEKIQRRREAMLQNFVKKVEPEAVRAATQAVHLPSLSRAYKASYLGIM